MVYDFQGSIAQLFIKFAATISVSAVPGENYYKVMLFVGHAEASAYFSVVPALGSITTLTSATYNASTIGPLNGYLDEFYASNVLTTVFVVIYDDALVTTSTFPAEAVTALTTQFNLYHDRAYFKLMSLHNNIPANSALATLCLGDQLLSQCWIDANDAQMLVGSSTTSMYGVCNLAGSDPVLCYHPDVTKSPALTQLGLSLGLLNDTGTPVGNTLDYRSTLNITASGTAGANLAAADMTTLEGINTGFYLTVGDTTGAVALHGGLTIKGNDAAAQWLVQYVDYCAAVSTAEMLTQPNQYKNNETYQKILLILRTLLYSFSNIGRLSGVAITAPTYSNLPPANGDVITVPNAWQATFNSNVRSVNVQGTLYITAS